MWSSEINEHMKDEQDFIGCFPYDKLPPIMKKKKKQAQLSLRQTSGGVWLTLEIGGGEGGGR